MKTKTNLMSPNGKFNSDQLNRALMDVEDLFQRALCPFVLLGQTARDVVDGKELSGGKIVIGAERKHLTKEVLSTLRVFLKDQLQVSGRSFSYEPVGLPKYQTMPKVEIRVINKNWRFLKNKDSRFHMNSEYQIPNPFEEYFKSRGLLC